jgi:uncharacterized membrane protein YphA (DoxX/SURF4 family)
MAVLFLLGRLIFGAFFIVNGLNHFIGYSQFVAFAAAKGVPLAGVAIPVAGALILFGGTSILLGWRPLLGVAAIVLFLVGVTFPMHNFWAESGAARMNDIINFTKNLALVGATLIFVAVPRPWAYSVEAPSGVRI